MNFPLNVCDKIIFMNELFQLLSLLHCLVPCYIVEDDQYYYGLVQYCKDKFRRIDDDNGTFAAYEVDGKIIYLDESVLNTIKKDCKDCEVPNEVILFVTSLLKGLNILAIQGDTGKIIFIQYKRHIHTNPREHVSQDLLALKEELAQLKEELILIVSEASLEETSEETSTANSSKIEETMRKLIELL